MTAKRYEVALDDHAIEDLAAIRDFIAQQAPAAAAGFIDKLLNEIYRLEMFPYGHQRRSKSPRLPFPLWRMPFRSYRIIYTIFEDQGVVRILGVQHGGRAKWP